MFRFISLVLALVLAYTSIFAQQRVDGVVKFEKSSFDFGKIKRGKPVTCDFSFQNISSKPIAILQVQTSCGCTTPHYPQVPIMPSKSDKINVGYDANTVGVFRKTIFVQISGVPEIKELIIKGEVLP